MYAVDGRRGRRPCPSGSCTAARRRLERIALDVDDLGPVIRQRACDEASRVVGHHREVDLPVLVAHRRRVGTGVVEEDVARRLFRLARQIVDLVDAVERRLDDARDTCPASICFVQPVALGAAGDVNERRQPVERGEDVVEDRARLDDARPANDARSSACRLPRWRASRP